MGDLVDMSVYRGGEAAAGHDRLGANQFSAVPLRAARTPVRAVVYARAESSTRHSCPAEHVQFG
jgi:hypothetical protein